MTLIRKLAWALCLVGSLIASSTNAQDYSTTGNLLNMMGWSGTTYPNPTIFNDCCSGGPGVAMNTDTNTLRFSYGASTASQSIAIASALSTAGAGLKVVGYNYSWQIMNDLSNSGGTRGTLTGLVTLTDPAGAVLKSYSYDYSKLNTGNNFQLISGTETFGPLYELGAVKSLNVSFTGKDQNWWAGYYGPRVREANVSLNYMTDPCATNPAYSPSCPGFSSVKFSGNLGQAYAIQTALANSGSGLIVHGFNYGFDWHAGQNCTFELIFCWTWGPADVGATVSVTNSSGATIASKGYGWNGYNTSGSVTDSIRFQSSQNQLTLGNFSISGWGNGGSYINNVWSQMVYSPDLCDKNPLYSPNCNKFVSTVLGNQKAAQQATMSSVTDTTGTTTTTTSGTVAAYTSSTAMADPTKNDVTSSNIGGGVQVTSTGEVTTVVNVPKFVRSANEAGEVVKEKEKPKMVIKPVVVAIPAPVQRREAAVIDVTRLGSQDSTIQAEEKTVTVVAARVQQQQDFVQQQIRSTTTAMVSSRRVIAGSYEASEDNSESSSTATRSSGQSSLALGRGLGLQANEMQAPQRQSMMNATSPLNSYLTMVPSENAPDQKATVKRDVQNNELAGGVDLAKMAIQPRGFNDYMNLTLTDAAFYGAKEVYKEQRVVDNARAQRLLQGASDRMYQEMVNSQYKLGE